MAADAQVANNDIHCGTKKPHLALGHHDLSANHQLDDDATSMITWIQNRIKLSNIDNISALWNQEDHGLITQTFLSDTSVRSLFATVDRSQGEHDVRKLVMTIGSPPSPSPGRIDVAYFVRAQGNDLTPKTIDDALLFGTFAMHQTANSVLNIMEKVFYPNIFHSSSKWNEASRRELMGLYHRFMASLTESANEENGRTTLYLPAKHCTHDHEFDIFANDKDWIQQLEAIAIHWTRQIKGVLNSQYHDITSESKGPIQELRYWKLRTEDLSGISDQLKCCEVHSLISILIDASSKYAKPVRTLEALIQEGLDQAENVVKFLAILQDPCERLSKLSPVEIPMLLPELMNCTRLIYTHSTNYNTNDKISDLLRRISDEIIRQCSKHVSLPNVFCGKVNEIVNILKQCRSCCQCWKDLYNRTALSINGKASASWKLNDTSIFAATDAFMQRCEDLVEICRGRTQFMNLIKCEDNEAKSSDLVDRLFKAMNDGDMETTFLTVSKTFRTQIDRLRNLHYNILDARVTQWHDDYNALKTIMKDLDMAIINVINKTFSQVVVIDDAIQMLITFQKLAHRGQIKICVTKKANDVRTLFKNQCHSIRKEFDDFHRSPPLRVDEPQFAGAALWAQSLSKTIDHGWALVCRHAIESEKDIDDLEIFVNDLKSAIHSYQCQKYDDWICTFVDLDATDFQERLNQPLLSKDAIKQSNTTIVSNFNCDIIALYSESHFWDKLHMEEFTTPNIILGICHQREMLRLVRERVMKLVRSYNSLIGDMCGISNLFSDHLRYLEKRIKPGFSKITWTTHQRVIERFVQTTVHEVLGVHCKVRNFHSSMKIIRKQCQILTTLVLVDVNRNISYKGRLFETKQAEHRKKTITICSNMYKTIKNEVDILNDQFRSQSQEVLFAWKLHLASVDTLILQSLLQCVKISLHTLYNAINGHEIGGESHPLFSVSILLKNGAIECRPSMINVTNSINIVAKEMMSLTKSMKRMSLQLHNGDKENFYDDISSNNDVLDIIVQIMKGTSCCVTSVGEKLLQWESYRSLWDMDKDSFLRRYSKSKENSFESEVMKYQDLESSIKRERTIVSTGFIQMNFSTLKSDLVSHSVEFQQKLLDLLEKKTKDHLLNLHIFLDDNILKLKRPINSLADLCAITILLIPVERKCNALSDDIPPLERTHSFLRKQGKVYINSEQEKMVKSLKPKQKELIDSIQDAKEMKDKTKIGIKAEFQATVLSHNEKKLKLCHRLEEAFSSSETATSTHAQIWIDSILTEIQSLKTREENLQKGLEFFGMDMATSQRLEDLKANLNLMQNVLYNHDSWRIKWKEWLQVSLASLKIEEMEESSIFFTKELTKAQKGIRQWSPWKCFCQELEDFNRIFPLIQCLLNPALRQRHWRKLERAICRKLNFSPDAFTVNDIFLLGLQRHSKLIFDLVTQANNELTIEYTLKDMESRLSQTMIDITEYKDTFKICATDDLLTKIEDDMMSLQSVKSSAFVTAFHIQVEAHEKDLNKVLECIEKIIGTQRQWLYLENIFMVSDGDIDSQLPQQCKNFADVNRKYKTVMKQIHDVKQVKSISNQNLLQTLEYMTVQMEEIQKALDNYLELKRQVFPRFYFISDDDLLELIGKSKEPCFVQKHMKKCFEGANSLIMKANDVDEEGYHVAIGVRASDGEVINFVENVAVEGSVEFWFGKVLEAIQLGVKQALHDCFKDLKLLKRELWIQKWHGQVLITAGSVAWAKSCHRALQTIKSGKDRYALRIYRKKQISNLRRLSAMVIETSQEKIQHSKIVTLITVEVHNRDVVEKLMKNGCQDPNDFTWKSQLRFNMEHDGKLNRCIVNQMNNTLDFGYEYQGNNGRLVVTPLTERCVLTLITAKSLHRGGNPLGPAGTGKTETVKDLAKNLAYFCVILNCSETMDVKSVGRIFAGLCQSGSWGCFDEFNRMKIEVLSVVATQIGAIFNAIRCNQSSFHFMGKDIKCSAKTGIFITTNPGYAGRHELPENLKALMRPVAMMAPDIILISEVTLSSQGFSESRSLSKKIIALYKLMQQQLSQQLHYDYGLRNIKSVLILAGSIKRMQNDIINEETVILQAIKCINEPKLTNDDMQLFQLLLCDLFSKREPTKHDQEGRLHKAIDEVLCEKGLQTNINMITKTMQLANIMKVRQCNMIIGETLTGKTSIWKTLSLAKQLVHPESDDYVPSVVKFVINPKALTVEELYGSYDNATFEWKDGVLSTIFKHCSEGQKQDIQKWIVFDGPIDALWVESMNSVMDDNKTLTLVNGDRIPLTSTMSLLFETDSLQAASPATVSRAGMVYVNGGIEWTSLVQNWVQKHNKLEEHRVFFEDLCKKYFGPLLQLKQGLRTCCYHSSESTIAKTFITMCDVFFTTLSHISLQDLEKWIVLCIAWSFGASLDFQDRKLIDQCIRDIDSHLLPPRSLFDYHINPKTNEYELWETKISIGPFSVFQEIVIPTESHARYSYILDQSIKMGHRSLVVGNSGCGKSSLVNAVLGRTEVWSNMTINLSPSLASSELQYTITEKLEKKSKDKLAPINGADKLLIFIDDLNLPRESSSESPFKPSLEFIQHFLSYGGWYHKKTCAWQSVIDTAMICAMTTPAGGRSMIPDRLQSRFNVINHADLSEQELVSVFQSVLTHKFKSCPSEIKSVLDLISKATIDIYKQSYQAFLPVPGKCFYGFTLHDVFRVAQGMFLIDSNDIETKESLQFLWVHECQRSFSDRFVNDEDQKTFLNILFNALEHYMHSESISYQCVKHEDSFALPNFAPNLEVEKTNAISLNRYNQIHDKERFCEALQKNLNDYNINKVTYKANMNLVLFDDAIGHICRISRVLHMHRGNMLFIGVGGSGRESLTRLSAFIFNFNVFTMRGSRKHKKDDFREDLKSFCMQCGVKNKQSIFFLKDKHVKHEIVLEDINQLMISGDVPRLYGKEEKALICKEVKKDALYEGVKDSEQSLWNFFIQRSMKNMHFVIALNPLGKNFSARIYEYPCLLRCSTINYFNKWPEEALEKVAYTHLSQFDYVRESASPISKIFAGIHDEAHLRSVDMKRTNKRCNHLTPRHFLELAFEFERCLEKKKDELFHHQKKLSGGLTKLEDGRTHVEILKQDLEEKQKIVGKSQTDCEVMLETIVSEKQRAEKKRGEMIKDSIRIEKEEQHQSIIASEAEADLAIALPALQSALEQVEKLEKSSITEIKAYSSPPVAVERVLSCVMILFGKETHWASAKRYLGDTNFLFHLKTFDKDNVKETTIAKITKYIKSPSFGADEVYKVSKAAGALCVWCHAIYQYAGVTKHVAPKRIKLKKAQEGLQIKQHDMKKTEEELDTATKELQALRREYERSVEKKNELSSEALSLANKLDKAEKLIGGLSGEYSRWNKTIGEIEKHLETIIGEAILSAAFLSYAGPFDLTHRSILINEWKRISFDRGFGVSSDFRPAHLLSTSSERRNWNLNGLPKDSFSTENAVIISNTTRWPLLIDPQGQGASWITAMEGNDLTIIDVKSTSLLHDIEVALTLGLPTMVVNVKEELDSALDNLLSKTFKKQDRDRREVNLGGKVINYNERFHLYLISSLAFPNFATEISSITNIVDFTVTEVGLEEQLLSLVVNEENSDLAKEKSIIVLKLANDKQKLREIEDNILALLSESSGNFIDDELLLNALQRSKQTARDIEKQVVADKKTEERIDIARESYRLAARRSSLIFLTLQDLSTVGCMYQYSLDWYMELFRQNIRSCKKPNNYDEPDRRVETINQHHTLNIYQLTSTGLFQKDKVLFAFQLCIRIMQNMGLIKPSEVDFFCDGKFMTSGDVQKKILNIQWLDKTVLDSLPYLDNIIDGFVTHIKVNEEHWRQWHRSEKPEEMPLPDKLDSKLSIIQKLCVLRTMRKDRVPFAVTKLVSKVLGHQFSNEPQLNLAEVVKVSSSTTPIVIILSSGIDSTDQISSLASFSSTAFNHIALGQGQSHAAHHAINIAKSTGGWVLLANCHLMPDWMDSLELIVDKHSNELIHENFRLWLSSKPTPYFPLSVLQRALKITTEPPTGLQANMSKLYNFMCPADFETDKCNSTYRKCIFSLTWFHSVLLERRKFKSLGFNKLYDFNDSDYLISNDILINMLEDDASDPPLKAIRYLIGDVIYGGRVTDEWDRKLIGIYLNSFFSEDLLKQDRFMLSDLLEYYLPEDGNLESYMSYVSQLPNVDDPAAFGQHPNAEISSQIDQTNSLLSNISSLRTFDNSISSPAFDIEEFITFRFEGIPNAIELNQLESYKSTSLDSKPMKSFLIEEIMQYNKLLELLHETRDNLHKTARGLIDFTSQLSDVLHSLVSFKVPKDWMQFYPSLKSLDSWMNDLKERVNQLKSWISNKSAPNIYWLSGFTNPLRLLTCVLQSAARSKGCAIDSLSWDFIITKEKDIKKSPDGLFVSGLYIEGAQWDAEKSHLQEPKALSMHSQMPIIHFKPVEMKRRTNEGFFHCPLYMYPERAGTSQHPSYLMTVDLHNGIKSADHWSKHGVALVLSTAD